MTCEHRRRGTTTSPEIERASGALPEVDPFFAPGLQRRAFKKGSRALWIPPKTDIKKGYLPKSITFPFGLTELEIARRCREQWHDLTDWRTGIEKPNRYTIGWLVDHYLNDDDSPFWKHKPNTQANYRIDCNSIKRALGAVRFDPVRAMGNTLEPRILGRDLNRWHKNFGRPVELADDDSTPVRDQRGKIVMVASKPSRARHLIMMVRALFAYAVQIGAPGASAICAIFKTMKFAQTEARDVAPTREQIYAFADAALAEGYLSMAITTLAQFELNERRISIIGIWEGSRWRPGWLWSGMSEDWTIRYFQRKKVMTERLYDLKDIPRLLALLRRIPKDERVGPIIKNEHTRSPWRTRHYCDEFKRIKKLAGWPDDLWSMDARAGGATETDSIEGVTDRALQDSGGWADAKTPSRYRRHKQRNAQNVVKQRQSRQNGR